MQLLNSKYEEVDQLLEDDVCLHFVLYLISISIFVCACVSVKGNVFDTKIIYEKCNSTPSSSLFVDKLRQRKKMQNTHDDQINFFQ